MKRRRPIVAIDGPVGSGKSTVARELARELEFTHVSTGAMYRAVAVAARDAGISDDAPDVEARLSSLLAAIDLRLDGDRVILGGRDISGKISTPEISDRASKLSALAVVRARMRELQRAAGRDGGIVMEGRDIGTVIFPDAEFKFFLDADAAVRAQRRFAQLGVRGGTDTREQVLADLQARDRRDRQRQLAPLKRADDAIAIDSTHLGVAQVVTRMRECVERARPGAKGLKPK